MDAGLLHGLWTAAMIAVFVTIVAWAWSGRRKRDFEEAARLPLEREAARLPAVEEPDAEQDVTDPRTRGARHG